MLVHWMLVSVCRIDCPMNIRCSTAWNTWQPPLKAPNPSLTPLALTLISALMLLLSIAHSYPYSVRFWLMLSQTRLQSLSVVLVLTSHEVSAVPPLPTCRPQINSCT